MGTISQVFIFVKLIITILAIHYNDVIMGAMASRFTGVSIVCSSVGTGVNQRKHQSSASLGFVRGIHRWPVNSPHKRPVTREMFPFDDVIMRERCPLSSVSTIANIGPPIKSVMDYLHYKPTLQQAQFTWIVYCRQRDAKLPDKYYSSRKKVTDILIKMPFC